MDFTVGIVSRNLAITSNFIEFLDSRNLVAPGVVRDTWHLVSGSRGATCHVQNESNNEPSGAHMRHMASCHLREIRGRWMRR